MGRGILSGILWGAAISIVALVIASIVGPMPDRIRSGTVAEAPEPENAPTKAQLPASNTQPEAPSESAPDTALESEPPSQQATDMSAESADEPVPDAQTPIEGAVLQALADREQPDSGSQTEDIGTALSESSAAVGDAEISLTELEPEPSERPETITANDDTAPAALPITSESAGSGDSQELSSEIDRLLAGVQPLDAPSPQRAQEQQPQSIENADADGDRPAATTDLTRTVETEAQEPRPAQTGQDMASAEDVRIRRPESSAAPSLRLPQVGVEPRDRGNNDQASAAVSQAVSGGNALSRNAVQFDDAGTMPLISMIVIDDGTTSVSPAQLAEIGGPVSVAVDPTVSGAEKRAEGYRAAGLEVVVLANGLPDGATPQDVEVTLQSYLLNYPNAVAVMDTQEQGFGNHRALTTQALAILKDSGHGAIGWSKGLGTVRYRNATQPVAMIHRRIDERAGNAGAIRRSLDRAAFEATQKGSAVVVGSASEATLAAFADWAQDYQLRQISLAPVSAILRADSSR